MANETTKPEAMVSDVYVPDPLQELNKLRERWESALAAAKRDGIREGLEIAAKISSNAAYSAAIRAKANEVGHEARWPEVNG